MNLQNSRVLIVDDQPANVHVLAETLGKDHELMVAESAGRALELAPTADLVLLDALMPGGGVEMCRRLRTDEATKRIPIILVLAGGEPAEAETRGFEAGASDCLAKPINRAALRARVRTHLELKAARDLVERMVTQDALTGLANRRRFDEAAREEWRRSMRFSQVLTVVLAGIDHFKAFTDGHGPDEAEARLRLVADALQGLCRRPGELAARYGAEEFVFLLPGTDLEAAQRFVSRVLNAVAAVEVEGSGVSVGAVTLIPSPLNSLDGALRDAEHGLKRAQDAGRGRGAVRDQESGQVLEVLPGA